MKGKRHKNMCYIEKLVGMDVHYCSVVHTEECKFYSKEPFSTDCTYITGTMCMCREARAEADLDQKLEEL